MTSVTFKPKGTNGECRRGQDLARCTEEHSDLPRFTHHLSGTQLSDNVVESLPQVSQVL